MIFLFLHQNFPAQYRHLVRFLTEQPDNQVLFITQPNPNQMRGVSKLVYQPTLASDLNCHPFLVDIDIAVRTGLAVAELCKKLRDQGVRPDIVIGHNGWGETLFVKEVFPDAPLLSYFEFYYHIQGADVGFDPNFPMRALDGSRLLLRNTINHISFSTCDWGHTATRWQRSLYPIELRSRITALHEGVDTSTIRPDPQAWLKLARHNLTLTRNDEVITYVARNLEPYRGFHMFMCALPELLRRRPKAHVIIVGGDGVSYGQPTPAGTTYREIMLKSLGSALDLGRIHFLGQVPYLAYLNILQVSSVHVYLTYPFVLSWSFIEAMAAGCLVIGSRTPPVLEVLRDRENGLAVDFFSPPDLVQRIEEVLEHPDRMQDLREAARATAVRDFDLKTRQLPRWMRLFTDLIEGRHPTDRGEP